VVVATDDAVLIASKERAQEVRAVVERLQSAGRTEHVTHRLVHRPWGSYRTISLGDRFQVKEIIVKPGASLSLQKHHHRAEHWVVVEGTAAVVRGEDTLLLHENQSIFIPLGTKHRLSNPGKLQLRLIEVQSGPYLGEDDIVRFEDNYGRAR
jgi:mannose-1-phosphate guanylyltransferase / mannose-6-phosphate isomerase